MCLRVKWEANVMICLQKMKESIMRNIQNSGKLHIHGHFFFPNQF